MVATPTTEANCSWQMGEVYYEQLRALMSKPESLQFQTEFQAVTVPISGESACRL